MNDDAMLTLLQDLQTAVANGDYSAVQTIREIRLVLRSASSTTAAMKPSTAFSS
jgi:hypothetical protein